MYELPSLARHLLASENADGHYFEPVRGEVPDSAVKALSLAALEGLHREIQPVYAAYAKRLFARLGAPARQVATVYYLGNLALHSDIHERCFERPARWPMRCTAGETSLVIDHNGKFRACELRGCVGDLHAFDFDVKAALQSVATEQEIEAIQRDGCWCTHSCFIQDSSKFSALVQLWMLPVAGVQQWLR